MNWGNYIHDPASLAWLLIIVVKLSTSFILYRTQNKFIQKLRSDSENAILKLLHRLLAVASSIDLSIFSFTIPVHIIKLTW